MGNPSREEYFEHLKRELNPTIWVTEWMSNRLMNVEFLLDQNAETVIKACFEGIREFLEARSFGSDLVEKIVEAAPYTTKAKLSFNLAFKGDPVELLDDDRESSVHLALYCFLHVAFTYKLWSHHR